MTQKYSTHNQRYSSHNQISSRLSPRTTRQPHAAAHLLQKESQIDLVKKRISALCVREQRYNNRTVNTDTEIQRRDAVQRESLRIQLLLDKQRQKEIQKLDVLRYRNLQTRAENYFRGKKSQQDKIKQAESKSKEARSRSRELHSILHLQKSGALSENQKRMRSVHQLEKKAVVERSRVLSRRRQDVIGQEHREAEHLNKLKDIKDYQLVELGKLELMMVEKSNTSRAAYDAKRQLLYSRESRSRLGTKTNRERKPSQLSTSLHIY